MRIDFLFVKTIPPAVSAIYAVPLKARTARKDYTSSPPIGNSSLRDYPVTVAVRMTSPATTEDTMAIIVTVLRISKC